MSKIRIAFVKYAGLSAGGTEKFLQTIAAHLPKDKFTADYFYTESGTDPHRKAYLEQHGIRLIPVALQALDSTRRWIGTDFWKLFKEEDYDLVQTGRSGPPEYPFSLMKRVPIIDSLHLVSGVDNQKNIARVMHISQWSLRRWVRMGGDQARARLVSHPIEEKTFQNKNYRRELNLQDKFIFGFHQRNDDHLFSPIPLDAFQQIAGASNHFIILGGGARYREQANALHLSNVTFLPHSADPDVIYSFLSALNVYAHGRKDGEINSTAMAEAQRFGLPIVSHYSEFNNGHVEYIGAAGRVVEDAGAYAEALRELQENAALYADLSEKARAQFQTHFELKGQMRRIAELYQEAMADPFPNPLRRTVLDMRQRVLPYRFFWKIRNRIGRWFGRNPAR